jgi:putative AdoMet-dependent methyltransferase
MNRTTLFNNWAIFYDKSIGKNPIGYPFEGYYTVLKSINDKIEINKTTKILDIGVGTGLLTTQLYKRGGKIYGIDFSEKMIIEAQKKMPKAVFYCSNFENDLPDKLNDIKFDYIVSSYAFHHLSDNKKLSFIKSLLLKLTKSGKIYIGDVSFKSKEDMKQNKLKFIDDWDHTEIYFIADQFLEMLHKNNIKANHSQISFCAGVFELIKT